MDTSHYDVIAIGSGFGGSVAAIRAAEKGYRVGVMEAGKRWPDSEIPQTNWDMRRYLWQPEAGLYGMQKMASSRRCVRAQRRGRRQRIHVYGNTLYVPPQRFFDAPDWAGITDWAEELAPCIDQAKRMLGVVRVPYMPTDVDRHMRAVDNTPAPYRRVTPSGWTGFDLRPPDDRFQLAERCPTKHTGGQHNSRYATTGATHRFPPMSI